MQRQHLVAARLGPTTWETRSRRPLLRRASGDARLERAPPTQDHHPRVPRPVLGCRCAPRELDEHAAPIGALLRPTTARWIASSSTPPRSAACCAAEAIAAGARTARGLARHGATGADRHRAAATRAAARGPRALARPRSIRAAPALQRQVAGHGHAATCEGDCEGGWCGVLAALLVSLHESRGCRCR